MMEETNRKGNILLVGNSGVGKSTLINSILGENVAKTGYGIEGTTKEIKVYESDKVPFRLIDTAGFEPSKRKISELVKAIDKDCKQRAKDGDADNDINVIWFCIDGAAAKLFRQTVTDFLEATSTWKSVPIIVVITKSYSAPLNNQNAAMVNLAFASVKKNARMPLAVIPIVAAPLQIDDDSFIKPYGVPELIEKTNFILPTGFQAAEKDVKRVVLSAKDNNVNGIIYSSTAAAAAIGAIPLPIPDALILAPLETKVISSIASTYEAPKGKKAEEAFKTIVELGTVGAVAKGAIAALKAIPGLRLGTAILNAIVAGAIVMGLGQGCKLIYREIYLGEKSLDDIDWIIKIMNNTVASEINTIIVEATERLKNAKNSDDVKQILLEILGKSLEGGLKLVDK